MAARDKAVSDLAAGHEGSRVDVAAPGLGAGVAFRHRGVRRGESRPIKPKMVGLHNSMYYRISSQL